LLKEGRFQLLILSAAKPQMGANMRNADYRKLRKSLTKALDTKRFEHTLGVSYTAAALAMCYGADIRTAEIAGLLHDCARCLSDERMVSICDKHNISVSDLERRNPYLLHAKVGGYLAMEEYHVKDQDIIKAILNHLTGRPAMSLVEKIVYVADYIEPNRKRAPHLDKIRKEAFVDLDRAVLDIAQDTILYVAETNRELDPATIITRDYYRNLLSDTRS
jgi:predicted HD superfamily hydrolase involved in NAD metabolism